jgi:hypothetical protein
LLENIEVGREGETLVTPPGSPDRPPGVVERRLELLRAIVGLPGFQTLPPFVRERLEALARSIPKDGPAFLAESRQLLKDDNAAALLDQLERSRSGMRGGEIVAPALGSDWRPPDLTWACATCGGRAPGDEWGPYVRPCPSCASDDFNRTP